jgi:hypothetical protein
MVMYDVRYAKCEATENENRMRYAKIHSSVNESGDFCGIDEADAVRSDSVRA